MPQCSDDTCGRPATKRGMCGKHYLRAWRAAPRAEPRQPQLDWLREQFDNDPTDECYPLPGQSPDHYGIVTVDGGSRGAHALVCEWQHGPRPEGLVAAHICGWKACVNRRHLRWATPAENTADRKSHGTALYGEQVPSAVLTAEQVVAIRRRYADGERGSDLAVAFGVSRTTIHRAATGRTWGTV